MIRKLFLTYTIYTARRKTRKKNTFIFVSTESARESLTSHSVLSFEYYQFVHFRFRSHNIGKKLSISIAKYRTREEQH